MVKEIKDKELWNNFIFLNNSSFLQSWQWGEFQKSLRRKIFRLGTFENDDFKNAILIIKYDLPFKKSYLYCSRIAIKNSQLTTHNSQLIEEIKKIGEEEKAIFFRIDPLRNNQELRATSFKPIEIEGSAVAQPRLNWELNLEKKEEELLEEMHPKTRYNIKLAERKGVKIREGKEEDLESFYNLLKETAERDKFKIHSKEHYSNLYKIFKEDNLISLFLAEHENDLLASIMVLFFNKNANFLHGASSNKKRNLMIPHLIQWEAIKEAKKRGCLIYDFGAISEEKKSWQGITRFKKSFGGYKKEYPATYDLVLNKFWYNLYNLGRKIL